MIKSFYLSHGAPPLLEEDNPYVKQLNQLHKTLASEPFDLIIVASPHWITHDQLLVQTSDEPNCIQDYYGFPDRFYQYSYQVSGAPEFAKALIQAGIEANIPVDGTTSWGLDHGAWVPLYILFPERRIPVLSISSGEGISPEEHYRWGEIIRETTQAGQQNVLFLGTGSTVHRLDQIHWQRDDSEIYPPGQLFDEYLIELLKTGRTKEILDIETSHPDLYTAAAPEGDLKSLYIALGVAGESSQYKILSHQGWHYGVSLLAAELI